MSRCTVLVWLYGAGAAAESSCNCVSHCRRGLVQWITGYCKEALTHRCERNSSIDAAAALIHPCLCWLQLVLLQSVGVFVMGFVAMLLFGFDPQAAKAVTADYHALNR